MTYTSIDKAFWIARKSARDMECEGLDAFEEDYKAGRLNHDRLIGYLMGLTYAGVMDIADFCDCEALILKEREA